MFSWFNRGLVVIRPDVRFENLNPVHARRLIDAANLARPHRTTLWVLHDSGRALRMWHDERGAIPLPKTTIEPSLELAARWSAEYEAADVRIVDLTARERFLRWAQDPSWVLEHDGMGYAFEVYEGFWRQDEGLIVYPRREAMDRFVPVPRAREFLSRRIDRGGAFLLGITEGKGWWASLIILLENGEVARVSTFDDLPEGLRKGPTAEDPGKTLAREAARHYRRKATVLLLPREDFEEAARRSWSGLGGRELPTADP